MTNQNSQHAAQSGSEPTTRGAQQPTSTSAPENNITRDMPVLQGPPNRACYKHTCTIQRCLSESNYDSRACQWAIDALKRCCEMKHARGSIHCAFPDLKMEDNKEEQKEKEGVGNEVKNSENE